MKRQQRIEKNLCCCRRLDNSELKRLWLMKGSLLFGFFCTSGTWKQQDASGDLKHDQEIQLKCATLPTQHPVLHGPWLLTANYYSPKSHTLLHNCRGRRERRDINTTAWGRFWFHRGGIFLYIWWACSQFYFHACGGLPPRLGSI